MSRNGNCPDNVPVERVFGSLKNELKLSNLAFFSLCPLFLSPKASFFLNHGFTRISGQEVVCKLLDQIFNRLGSLLYTVRAECPHHAPFPSAGIHR